MLVTYEDEKVGKKAFTTLVADLTKKGYIVAKLVSGTKKWMGYIQLEGGVARRLDLLLTPPEEFAYALLYFTGSDRFNVAFRRHCLDLGYTLNEHSMKLTEKGTKQGVRLPPPMKTEQDIFAFVGLRYVPPTERVDGAQIVPV
jgi:DNA polymerase/3'-5' exonuclease PolX